MSSKFYSIAEAAKRLKISRQAVHDAVAQKRLRSTRQTVEKIVKKKMNVIVIAEADLKRFAKTISRSHQERGKKNEPA